MENGKQDATKDRGRQGVKEEGVRPPILFCMNIIRLFSTANRRQKGNWRGGSEMRTDEERKEEEIRNLSPCGMKMAPWHQFSRQSENCAACSMHKCKHALEGAKGGERDEGKEETLSLSTCRGGKIEWAERMEAACYDRNGAQES